MVLTDREKHPCFSTSPVAHSLLPSIALHVRDANGKIGHIPVMKRRIVTIVFLAAVVTASPALADRRSDAKAQVAFGIHVAQRGLWREAIYRWEKAVELDPHYAAAFNNLAIAYEHEGQLEKARKAYEKAIELDPNSTEIGQNYELFKEINDRTTAKEKS